MACRERESGVKKIFLWLGFFWFATCHCASLTKLKALDESRFNLTLSHGLAEEHELHYGRLLIGQYSPQSTLHRRTKDSKKFPSVDSDYQADMGWGQPKQSKGQRNEFAQPKPEEAAVQELLKMEPKVECTRDSMRLQIKDSGSIPGSLLLVDRGSRLSPLPLSKLPASCGYRVRSTQRDLILEAPYDGCFVALEEDAYVLPLRCYGLPVKMSCPLMAQSSSSPPMVTCHGEGMVVKMEWTVSVAKIKVILKGTLEPLMKASPRCGFSVVQHPEGVVVSVPFAPCLEEQNGMYTLELHGEGETKISCPSPAQPGPTETPGKSPAQPTKAPSKVVSPPAQVAPVVPQVPGFPQYPAVDPKVPNRPQLPYLSVFPNFPYPYPENAKAPPTGPPPAPSVTKNQAKQTAPPAKLPLHPGGQMPFIPPPFYPFHFYTAPPIVPPVKPDPKPLPTASSHDKPSEDNKWPFYFPAAPVTVPPPGKKEEKPPIKSNSHQSQLPQEPVVPPASQPEGEDEIPPYALPNFPWPPAQPPYPLYPKEPSPGEPVHPPVPEGPKGPIYPGFHPFWPQGPVPPAPHMPIQNPQGQAKQTPKPPEKSEVPLDQVNQQVYPFYPNFYGPIPENQQNEPTTKPPAPAKPEAPKGPAYQPYYPHTFNNQPVIKPPTPAQPEAPQGQVYQPFNPLPENKPATKPPPVANPETPQDHQSEPENPPAMQPPMPPLPFHPYPFHPYPFPPWLKPHNLPAQKPNALPKPAATEPPKDLPSYPQVPGYGTSDGNAPSEKPTQNGKPPAISPPESQVPQPFNPYYYHYPQQPQPVTLPPVASTEKPQQVTTPVPTPAGQQKPQVPVIPQSSNPIVPQKPQPGSSPMYCPQFCPPGLSKCCIQFNYHQHVHHIVPPEPGKKDALHAIPGFPVEIPGFPVEIPGLPFAPSEPVLGTGFGPDKETEATTIAPPKPIPPETPQSKNEHQLRLQPPEGNPAALPQGNPSQPTSSNQQLYSYSVPSSLNSNWFHPTLNRQLPSPYGVPSPIPGNQPVNPMAQFQPQYVQTPEKQDGQPSSVDTNNPRAPFMPFFHPSPQLWRLPNAPNMELPANKMKSGGPNAQSEFSPRSPVSYFMLQDAGAPTHDKPGVRKNSTKPEAFQRSSKQSARHAQNQKAHFGPNKLVLLPHGPPRKQPHIFSEPRLPANIPQGKVQYPNGNYVSRPVGRSGFPRFFSASDSAHFMQLPQSPPVSTEALKPKSVDSSWTSRGHNPRAAPHEPKKTIQQYRSAAEPNGLKQPIQREGGLRK